MSGRRPRGAGSAAFLILLGTIAGVACRGSDTARVEAGEAARRWITAERLMRTVRLLSSESFAGRLAGSEGYRQAAESAARRFAELGLEPASGGGYLQHLEVEHNELVGAPRLALMRDGAEVRQLTLGRDFVARGFSGSGVVTAPVVFCGYGLSLPARGYDDYAGVDVVGKIVLALKSAPRWQLDDAGWGEEHLPRPKALTAGGHGARALLLVAAAGEQGEGRPIGSVMHGPGEYPAGTPSLHVSRDVAEELLAPSGLTLDGLQESIDLRHTPRSVPLDVELSVQVEARYEARQDTVNVVGIVPGGDPALADEHVIVGAHLDHVGVQGAVLFPGANDNASGSAAVLAMAEALAGLHSPLRRSVVLALFAAEEQGLQGARAYVAAPALPLERTTAMINLDCIGSGRQVRIGGGESSPRLWRLARALDRSGRRIMVDDSWWGGGADAEPFFEAGVPTIYVTTTDGYGHLHLPSDTPGTLDPRLLEGAARIAFATLVAVADGDYQREPRGPQKGSP